MRLTLLIMISSLLLAGCATNATVSPSQNSSLNTLSPNTAAQSKGGAMQNSLDSWLKEDWMPNNTAKSSTAQSSAPKADSSASISTDTTVVTNEKKLFTLQSYADKWKAYHENKEKMDEGKPKEPSHIETLQNMPVIGK